MTQEMWNKLDIKEQMSNIHGEVVRLIRARNNYLSGKSAEDHSESYMNTINHLLELTKKDPKNARRIRELDDEENEIKEWLNGNVSDDYILRYWDDYTRAIG